MDIDNVSIKGYCISSIDTSGDLEFTTTNLSSKYNFLDNNGVSAFHIQPNGAGTGGNGVGFFPGNTTNNQNPEFFCVGNGTNYGISFRGKGNWFFAFHASAEAPAKVRWYEQEINGNNAVGIVAPAALDNTFDLVLPNSLPTGETRAVVSTTSGVLGYAGPASHIPLMTAHINGSSGNINRCKGLTSCTKTGTGTYSFVLSQAFSDAAYHITAVALGNGTAVFCSVISQSSSSFVIGVYNASGTLINPTQLMVSAGGV